MFLSFLTHLTIQKTQIDAADTNQKVSSCDSSPLNIETLYEDGHCHALKNHSDYIMDI